MNHLLILLVSLTLSLPAYAGGEWKIVCRDRTDKAGKVVKDKIGKAIQDCKKIKVHKKLKGKVIPIKK